MHSALLYGPNLGVDGCLRLFELQPPSHARNHNDPSWTTRQGCYDLRPPNRIGRDARYHCCGRAIEIVGGLVWASATIPRSLRVIIRAMCRRMGVGFSDASTPEGEGKEELRGRSGRGSSGQLRPYTTERSISSGWALKRQRGSLLRTSKRRANGKYCGAISECAGSQWEQSAGKERNAVEGREDGGRGSKKWQMLEEMKLIELKRAELAKGLFRSGREREKPVRPRYRGETRELDRNHVNVINMSCLSPTLAAISSSIPQHLRPPRLATVLCTCSHPVSKLFLGQ